MFGERAWPCSLLVIIVVRVWVQLFLGDGPSPRKCVVPLFKELFRGLDISALLLQDYCADLVFAFFVGMKIHAHPAAIAPLGHCKLNSRPPLIDLVIDAFAVQVLKQGHENFFGFDHGESLEDELLAVSGAQDGQKFAGTRVLALPSVWLHFSNFV